MVEDLGRIADILRSINLDVVFSIVREIKVLFLVIVIYKEIII